VFSIILVFYWNRRPNGLRFLYVPELIIKTKQVCSLAIKHHRGILRDAFFGIKKKRSTPHKLLLYGSVWSSTTFLSGAIIAEYDDKVNNIFQNKLVPQAIRPALFLALE